MHMYMYMHMYVSVYASVRACLFSVAVYTIAIAIVERLLPLHLLLSFGEDEVALYQAKSPMTQHGNLHARVSMLTSCRGGLIHVWLA